MKSDTLQSRFTSAIVQKKAMLLIVVLALCIHAAFFLSQRPWDENSKNSIINRTGDSLGYNRLAVNILHTKSFAFFDTRSIIRPPGYPLFISLVYFFWGPHKWIVLLVQGLLNILTVVIAYLIAKELFESRAKQNVAAFLYAISLLAAQLSTRLLSEIIFTFVFTFSILFIIRAMKSGGKKWYVLAGCTIGVATLIRQASLYVPIIFCIVILFQKRKLSLRIFGILIIIVTFLATLSPWLIRNKIVHDHLALTNHSGFIVGRDHAVMVKSRVEKIGMKEAQEQLLGNSLDNVDEPFEKSRIWKEIGINYLSNNLLSALKYNIRGVIYMFLITERQCLVELFGLEEDNTGEEDQSQKQLESIFSKIARAIKRSHHEYFITPIVATKLLLEYLFLVVGLVAMFRSSQRLYAALFAMIILYFGLLPGIMGIARYKLPIIPMYLVLSASGVVEIGRIMGIARFRST